METLHFYNNIYIEGIINNIEFSHESNGKRYYRAIIDTEDNCQIPIKFREDKLQNINENDHLYITGNIRLFNKKLYVYTSFEDPQIVFLNRQVELFGKIAKKDEKFNSYIVFCGNNTYIPVKSKNNYSIDDEVSIRGFFVERSFTKRDSKETFITYEVVEN